MVLHPDGPFTCPTLLHDHEDLLHEDVVCQVGNWARQPDLAIEILVFFRELELRGVRGSANAKRVYDCFVQVRQRAKVLDSC